MTLKHYVSTQLRPNQQDIVINKVIERIQSDKAFPDTDHIKTIAEYLYMQLDPQSTTAFQKLLMFWKFAENNFQQPQYPGLLDEINHIITLQNNDANYPWAEQIPAHVNNRR